MEMRTWVGADSSFQDFNSLLVANLTNDCPQAAARIVFEDFFATLGDPDDVVLVVERGVAAVTILADHAHIRF
jgi:hypothetical protein